MRAAALERATLPTAGERAEIEARRLASAEARKQAAAEVIPWLRQLGFRADEARRGAERCEHLAGASLEERLRAALASLARPSSRPAARIASIPG
jgi:Mn-dependent DtxR family transcriptional regulator